MKGLLMHAKYGVFQQLDTCEPLPQTHTIAHTRTTRGASVYAHDACARVRFSCVQGEWCSNTSVARARLDCLGLVCGGRRLRVCVRTSA